jgi:hypothetical protein
LADCRSRGSTKCRPAPPPGPLRRRTTLEYLLTRNGWRRVAPTERFMSAMGTIALHILSRPD